MSGLINDRLEDYLPCVSLAAVEKTLEDEGGGYLVDDGAVPLAGVAGLIQNLVRFAGGEALVP